MVAATQALETIALRCCGGGGNGTRNGRACVQGALLLPNKSHGRHGDGNGDNGDGFSATSSGAANYSGGDSVLDTCDVSAVSAATSSSFPEVDVDDFAAATADTQRREALVGITRNREFAESIKNSRRGDGRREASDVGATAFALRVADCYSRDDSRTIVRRAGAARVAASALSLLRALLTDCGQRKLAGGDEEEGFQRDAEIEDDEDEASLASCVEEFCDEQAISGHLLC